VHLPELALGIGRHRRLGSLHGVLMERQRLVTEPDANILTVLVFDFLESRTDPRAERSLEI
jgi:hypothetical protein